MENRDVEVIAEQQLREPIVYIQSSVQDFCALLDRLVNFELVSHNISVVQNVDTGTIYTNLSSLIKVLGKTNWDFEIVSDAGNALFKIRSMEEAAKAHQVAYRFKSLITTHVTQVELGHEQGATVTTSCRLQNELRGRKEKADQKEPWRIRKEMRDQTVRGLRSLFLERSQSRAGCNGHRFLIRLPDWENFEEQKDETVLDLFLSTCADPEEWHAASCIVESSCSLQHQPVCSFCEDLTYARSKSNVFLFTAGDRQLYMAPEDVKELQADRNHHPRASLHNIIESGCFADTFTYIESIPEKRIPKFRRKQKRAIAAGLALCISLYLDSEYTLKAYDSKCVKLMSDDRDYSGNSAYVTPAINEVWKEEDFHSSMPIYTALATLLLEIECGFSQEGNSLEDIRRRVDFMLQGSIEEEREFEHRDAMIDIRDMMARTMYLEAIRDLLQFDLTYRNKSRYWTWRVLDTEGDAVGIIAREIIFKEVADKIRQTIDPRSLDIPKLADLKGESYLQSDTRVGTLKRDNKSQIRISEKLQEGIRDSPIQLFDDHEASPSPEDAGRADNFFRELYKWHDSCDAYLETLTEESEVRGGQGQSIIPRSSHRRVRIAILDTGINRENGAIQAGKLLGQLHPDDDRSWIGKDVQDSDGHGTRVAELILKTAPNADIYIGKVFTGSEVVTREAKNVAAAINYAVEEWKADIVSMSFGLRPLNSNDEELRVIYTDIRKAIEKASSTVFFGAAANHGGHAPRAFPAADPNVLCINASDGNGNDARINPNPVKGDFNFMTLGLAIDFGGLRGSGTSYAAPIAAGLAAHIIYVADCLLLLTDMARSCLRSRRGMRAMFELISVERDDYRFVAPWATLWQHRWHLDPIEVQRIEAVILKNRSLQH
ncbi:hypothetical protein FOBRF1_012361 [Fusarium oxysporum]